MAYADIITDRERFLELENDLLHMEIEELEKQTRELAALAARMATTSDHMKLQLIMNGLLTGPRDKDDIDYVW